MTMRTNRVMVRALLLSCNVLSGNWTCVRGAAQYLLDTRGLVVGGGVGGGVGSMVHCNSYSDS